MRRLLLALAFALAALPAQAQTSPQWIQNYTVPTAPFGTSNNQAASTAFVQGAVTPCNTLGAFPVGTGSGAQCSTVAGSTATLNGGPFAINPGSHVATPGFLVSQSGPNSGTTTASVGTNCSGGNPYLAYNTICIDSDGANLSGTPPVFTYGLNVGLVTGGANSTGNKIGLNVILYKPSASAPAVGRDHVALNAVATVDAGDGGTGTSIGLSAGTMFASGLQAHARSGATNLFEVSGGEVDVGIATGASASYRFGWEIVDADTQKGAVLDGALVIGGTGNGWGNGILLTKANGASPIATTGNVMSDDGQAATVASIFNFPNYTVTGNIFNFANFKVSGAGSITTAITGGGTQCLHASNTGVVTGTGSDCGSGGGITALTGDVTASGSGSVVATLANIPTGTPSVGTILKTNIAAPSSPAAGKNATYSDSTDLRFHDKNASGVIGTTVVADTGAANNYISAISAAGVITKSQPSCATLSDSSTGCTTTVGTMATQNASAVAITGGTLVGLTGLAIRDTSAAFDLTIAATSSTALTAGRTLTLDVGNVAHTLKFGTTANTITFPSVASDTVALLGATQTLTGVNTFSKNAHYQVVGGTGAGFWLDSVTTGADRWFFGSDASSADVFRVFSVLSGANALQYAANATPAASVLTVNGTVTATNGISAAAGITSAGATSGIGYATGAGGTVTQATSKSTGVTLSKVSGAITMNNAALAAGTIVSFTLTDSAIAATDVLVLNHISGGTVGSYTLNAQAAAGTATINVRNNTSGSLSDAIVIQFAVIKGVNS